MGKSTFATLLQTALNEEGIRTAILHLDHYGRSPEERRNYTNELDPRRIVWQKLHHTLAEIKSGKHEIVVPFVNQLTKERDEKILSLENVKCVLFEGCYTLGDFPPMDLLQYADSTAFLETPLNNIYDWKWEREFKKPSGRTPEAFFHHMMAILQDFAFHVYPTRKNAAYIVEVNHTHHYLVREGEA